MAARKKSKRSKKGKKAKKRKPVARKKRKVAKKRKVSRKTKKKTRAKKKTTKRRAKKKVAKKSRKKATKKRAKKKVAKKAKKRVAKKAKKKTKAKKKVAKKKAKARKKPAKRKPTPAPAKKVVTTAAPVAAPVSDEERVGVVTHYYNHLSVAVVHLDSGALRVGDTIRIKGHTSDFTQTVLSMEIDHVHVNQAFAGQSFGLKVIEHAREHDGVYRLRTP